MPFNIAEADRLLTTTRTVRKGLDLEREVDVATLLELIDVAEQAPSGSNQASRRWVIIRDPAVKKELAELYRDAAGNVFGRMAATPAAGDNTTQRVFSSGGYLAENLEHVPALVLLTIYGIHDGSGKPSLFDSVIQSGWSFCLAARARQLGTAWTTLHMERAKEAAALLGLPPGITQIALIAVAHTDKDDYAPIKRRPAGEITYFDHWGFTDAQIPEAERAHVGQGRGVNVELDIAASPARVWELISDIGAPGRHSPEACGARWTSEGGPAVGATFLGANGTEDAGHPAINDVLLRLVGKMEWETPCTVVTCEPGREFAYVVGDMGGDPANAWARWGFTIQPLLDGRSRVGHYLVMLAGTSGTSFAATENPESAEAILEGRFRTVRDCLTATLRGIQGEAETR
ncbi:MAG TPA: nitroreductase family protein [Sporichthyaceae bacterium]|nr:nitroreductase family protein [Sporichthyaceae bacterium]